MTGATLALLLAVLLPLPLHADDPVTVSLRGRAQSIVRLQPAASAPHATVLFLPGDGGWRGAAVSMARNILSMGYAVYGFDTKKYLEAFSENGAALSQEQVAEDLRTIAVKLQGEGSRPVIFVGWSQGAGMAVAAVALGPRSGKSPVHGVITLALPESAVLGWDWKATLAIISRREPDQPTFSVKPLLKNIAPIPIWMIHGTADEYTPVETERALFQAVREPKRLEEIDGANHRFDGRQKQLFGSLQAGLEWIAGR